MNQILKQIYDLNGQINDRVINDVIKSVDSNHMREMYGRYVADKAHVPIMQRDVANSYKINNKLYNNFTLDVVDTKTGYMGNEIVVQLKKEIEGYDDKVEFLRNFDIYNNSADKNSMLVKWSALCGYAARILYIDTAGETAYINVPSWEVIPIYEESIYDLQYALRYYPIKETILDGTSTKIQYRFRAEWYDTETVTFWISEPQANELYLNELKFEPDIYKKQPVIKHFYNGVPVVIFENNDEERGDLDSVLSLMDDYDRINSNISNELQQLAMGYLKMKGAGLNVNDEYIKRFQQTGILPLPQDGEADFLSKNLSDTVYNTHLDRLKRAIYQIAKSVDFSDQALSGNLPVIAWKIKTSGLEYKCDITERKIKSGLRYQYELLTDFWRQFKSMDIDINDLEFIFKRTDYSDIASDAMVLQSLLGSVSRKTAYSMMRWIPDADKEVEAYESEKLENIEKYLGGDTSDRGGETEGNNEGFARDREGDGEEDSERVPEGTGQNKG